MQKRKEKNGKLKDFFDRNKNRDFSEESFILLTRNTNIYTYIQEAREGE